MKTTILFILIFISGINNATEIVLNSEDTQTQVIELYTSEGCSSCPPADRWLSSLKSHTRLFKDFIPVAFHVGYWDYLGWKDELALPQNSNRQRRHKQDNNLNSVYTPGVLKAGNEWRRWRGVKINRDTNKVGALKLVIKNNKLKAQFNALEPVQYKLVVALLGMNIDTKVLAGENRGETLTHDFVLLKKQIFQANNAQWTGSISDDFFQSKHKNTALVAWIEKINNPAPIQAVGTFL